MQCLKLLRITTADISLNSLLKGQLRYLSQHFEVVGVAADTGVLHQVAEREGVRVVDVPMHREISLWADCKSLWSLIKLFRRERPDIVHANTPKASLLGMVAAVLCRVPNRIYTVTGLRFETTQGVLRFVLKTMERITCLCATKVIPEGDGVKSILLRERITRKPMQKVFNGNINGVDLEWYDRTESVMQRASEVRGDSTDFTFVFIGRIVRDKGINELVNAFQLLNLEFPDTRLLLVGAYEEKLDPIKPESVQVINTNSNIEHVGVKREDDLVAYYAASDCFVFPSYREGFPNTVMEAGAMGLPCIVTDINGSREIIIDGKNGVIIPYKDEDALYQAMRDMLVEEDKYKEYRSNARPLIQSRFEKGFVKQCLLDFYKENLL